MIGRMIELKAPHLVHLEPQPTNSAYSILQLGGVEVEVGEFLYGLVRTTKPDCILETGTFLGIAATFMGLALRENGWGKLTTIECNLKHVEKALELFEVVGVDSHIEVICSGVEDWSPPDAWKYDLLHLDSGPKSRLHELGQLWNSLKPGGIVVIHDASPNMNRGKPATIPEAVLDLILSHELQSIHLDTPTGLYLGQRAKSTFLSTGVLKRIP